MNNLIILRVRRRINMKIVYEFFNCGECPYCKQGRSYGTDGRDGVIVFICKQGAFGGVDGGYAYGKVIT